jgi:hypothetical protein
MKHQFYNKYRGDNWLVKLLKRARLAGAPDGTTIGPISYKDCRSGPNRKMRRHSAAIWRRYGVAAQKVADYRGIDINSALRIVMAK